MHFLHLCSCCLLITGVHCARQHNPSVELSPGQFRCGKDIFSYKDQLSSQGDQSVVSKVAGVPNGKDFVMKRPRYHESSWDDNMRKECFVLRYLNQNGVPGIPNCIAECWLQESEISNALQTRKSDIQFQRGSDSRNHRQFWHVIIMEYVVGLSYMHTSIRMGDEEDEKNAVERTLDILWAVLRAGIVNTDQRHNIMVSKDHVHFIDFELCDFINAQVLASVPKVSPDVYPFWFGVDWRSMRLREVMKLKWKRDSTLEHRALETGNLQNVLPDDMLRCEDWDVRLVEKHPLPKGGTQGVPEIFMDGKFRPLCGHCFWDNDIGAEIVCESLGYTNHPRRAKVLRHNGNLSSENALFVRPCTDGTNRKRDKSLETCSGHCRYTTLTHGSLGHKSPLPSGYSCSSGQAPTVEVACAMDKPPHYPIEETCKDTRKIMQMVFNVLFLVPPHAVEVAAASVASRPKLGDERLDAAVDNAWQLWATKLAESQIE